MVQFILCCDFVISDTAVERINKANGKNHMYFLVLSLISVKLN